MLDSLSRQPWKQRHKRHARYAFHVRLKNSRRNVRPKIARSVARPQGRPSRFARLRRHRRASVGVATSRALPHCTHTFIYIHPSMKYSHQTYERFTSGRSRDYKQPRLHVQGEPDEGIVCSECVCALFLSPAKHRRLDKKHIIVWIKMWRDGSWCKTSAFMLL